MREPARGFGLIALLLGFGLGEIAAGQETIRTPIELDEPPITQLGVVIAPPEGLFPDDRSPDRRDAGAAWLASNRSWPTTAKPWTPACTQHKPLYFEEVNAERYGYACAPCLQPAVSTAHFFGSAVALPYRMAAQPPCECVYTLGHYRPGDCAPNRPHGWPASFCGVGWQTATVIGLVALVP